MDIQVSSNFERLLFEMNGRDGGATAEQLQRFRATGRLSVEPDQRVEFLDGVFQAARIDDTETLDVIARTYRESRMLLDPHTAVGVGAVVKLGTGGTLRGTTVTLATAHPAKFPDAVERATGVRPALPPHLANLFDLDEHVTRLPNDLATIQHFVATAFSRT
jgi:threonine synthase